MRSAASAFQPSSCVHRATGMPSIVVRSGPRTGAPQGRVVTAQTSAKGRPALRPLRLGFSGSKNPGSRSSSYRCSLTSAAVHAGSGVQRQAATACGHWATGAPLSGCSTLRGQRPGVKVHAGEAVASSSGEFNAPARPDTLWYSRYDKEILALAIPALFSVLLDPLLSLVDTAIVGRLGAAQLGAVGLATLVFNFSAFLFSFLMVVTTPRVAAAVANDNKPEASRATAQGLQVGLAIGVVAAVALWYGAPALVSAMSGGADPKGDVVGYAITYLRCRCLASPAVLAIFVAIGSFRGSRDTVTPLIAAMAANFINLSLDLILIFVFGLGVAGAAIATTISQYVSCTVLVGMLIKRKMLDPADLLARPPQSELLNFLKAGVSLSSRNVISMAAILYATTSVTRLGAASLAAHEILRQVWIFAIQAFSALDIATQSLIATYLGQNMQQKAFDVLKRTLQLGVAAGVTIGLSMAFGASFLPGAFTSDQAVISIAARVFPVLAFYLPFDAVASIMDGSLLGAGDTGYLGRTMLVTGAVAAGALYYVQHMRPNFDLVGVWLAIKCLTLGRVFFGALRLFRQDSPLARRANKAGV
mmetsp:Transcript_17433/g.52263  ORF Transcript_17433/g.52263 Transcript_17433/m.52263 type:complete len:588 (-) Transcript_17433:751-2514(-)